MRVNAQHWRRQILMVNVPVALDAEAAAFPDCEWGLVLDERCQERARILGREHAGDLEELATHVDGHASIVGRWKRAQAEPVGAQRGVESLAFGLQQRVLEQ